MYHVGLFEGIGGFSLAASWAGLNSEISCEIDEDCRDALKSNFPNTFLFEDVKKLTKENFDEILISKYGENYGEQMLLTGGFPCQPFSYSGNRWGASDNRYLWPEMLRIIKSVRPRWVIGENVAGLLTMVLPPEASAMGNSSYYREGVLFNIIESLVKAEYDVQTFIIPACAVGAPHLRERLWIVARRNDIGDKQKFSFGDADGGSGLCKCESESVDWESFRSDSASLQSRWESFPNFTPIYRGYDGLSDELLQGLTCEDVQKEIREDKLEKIKEQALKEYNMRVSAIYGNAIVPQVAFEIIRNILRVEEYCKND